MYYSILCIKVNEQIVNNASFFKTKLTEQKEYFVLFFTKGYLQIWCACAIIILNIVYHIKITGELIE